MNSILMKNGRWQWLLLVVFVMGWFYTLGGRVLLDPDEARYAEIPREMVATGDWTTPRLNDLKYFEKPALQYWATAAAYKIFGVSDFTARLWCGLTGVFGVLFAGWAASRLYGRDTGWLTAALLGGSLFWVALGHLNTLDMALAFFLEVAIFSFLLAQQAHLKSRSERNWMLLAWCAAALAFLSKGVVAWVLPALALALYSLIEREFSAWKRLHVAKGLALMVAICAPWLVAVSRANPEFLAFFFVHEHLQRFLTDAHLRVEPWWYFIPIAVLGVLPWLTLAISSLKQQWQLDVSTTMTSGFRGRRFLLWWAASVVIFFSLSHSKLPPYILPIMPALALLAANYASQCSSTVLKRHLIAIAILLALPLIYVTLITVLPIRGRVQLSAYTLNGLIHWTQIALAIGLIGVGVGLWLVHRQQAIKAILAVCLGSFITFSVLIVASDQLRTQRSAYDAVQLIKLYHDRNKPFYSVFFYSQSVNFYLERSVTALAPKSELQFGLSMEPHKGLTDIHDFINRWHHDPSGTMAVIHRHSLPWIKEQIPMTVIASNDEFVAVIKP